MLELDFLPFTVEPHVLATFLLFAAVGFAAQMVDGALGMAYGVISTTVLLAFGVPPATASASVHAAEVFTTGASGVSHISHKNVDWRAFAILAPAGMVGGVAGAYLLTGIDGATIQPFVIGYLLLIGCYITLRAFRDFEIRRIDLRFTPPLGLVGGFLDAVGGGGWGPMVSSTLMGSGAKPRTVIGTVNTAEFFVTCAISAGFVWALVSGHWEDAGELTDHIPAVAGLVVGGVLAAPLAGYVVKIAPPKTLMALVGCLVIGLSVWQGLRLWG